MSETNLPATLKAAIFDCETTGLTPDDEIIECSLLLAEVDSKSGKTLSVQKEYLGLREPSVPIHPTAQRINKIEPEMLRGKTLDGEALSSLIAQADFFVAHNAKFDRHFLSKLFPEAKQKPWKCSCYGMGWKTNKGFPSKKLGFILEKHGIPLENAHRADADTKALLQLLDRQVVWLKGKRTYWQQLIKAQPITEEYWAGRTSENGYSPSESEQQSNGDLWIFIKLLIALALCSYLLSKFMEIGHQIFH